MADSTANLKKEIHQLVLLRGLARESRHWGTFIQDLETAYSERGLSVRVETIDLPGCGRHSEMTALLSIEETAEFVREKFKEILVREVEAGLKPADHRRLVAISLGGMVGAAWISKYPTDFHSSVAMNSSFRGISRFHERLKWTSWYRFVQILRSGEPEDRERQILDWISNRPERRSSVLTSWTEIQHTRPVSKINLALQLAAAARFQAPHRWPIPLLVLSGGGDRMVNPSCSQSIAKLYKATIHTHPTAGHDLALDEGPWVARMIAEWNPN